MESELEKAKDEIKQLDKRKEETKQQLDKLDHEVRQCIFTAFIYFAFSFLGILQVDLEVLERIYEHFYKLIASSWNFAQRKLRAWKITLETFGKKVLIEVWKPSHSSDQVKLLRHKLPEATIKACNSCTFWYQNFILVWSLFVQSFGCQQFIWTIFQECSSIPLKEYICIYSQIYALCFVRQHLFISI